MGIQNRALIFSASAVTNREREPQRIVGPKIAADLEPVYEKITVEQGDASRADKVDAGAAGQGPFLPAAGANELADRPDREDIVFGTLRNLIPRFDQVHHD